MKTKKNKIIISIWLKFLFLKKEIFIIKRNTNLYIIIKDWYNFNIVILNWIKINKTKNFFHKKALYGQKYLKTHKFKKNQ
jgi:hypothetical protein